MNVLWEMAGREKQRTGNKIQEEEKMQREKETQRERKTV
jgi:hypothetical protein